MAPALAPHAAAIAFLPARWEQESRKPVGGGLMPKLYEYFGLIILFYSNEHEPIHVHGKFQETESRAELVIDKGEIIEIRYSAVKGRKPLRPAQARNFKLCVEHYGKEIVEKWIDYFVYHKPVAPERITTKIK